MNLFIGVPFTSQWWLEFYFMPAGGFCLWVNRGPVDELIIECGSNEISWQHRFKFLGGYGGSIPDEPQYWLDDAWYRLPLWMRRYLK